MVVPAHPPKKAALANVEAKAVSLDFMCAWSICHGNEILTLSVLWKQAWETDDALLPGNNLVRLLDHLTLWWTFTGFDRIYLILV